MAKLFTEEQEEFLKDNAWGKSNQELADLINLQFGLNVTRMQVKNFKNNRRIDSGLTGRFEKGRIPVNKGTKGMFNVGGISTSFKKGERPPNYKPIGSERIDKHGYIQLKVSDEGKYSDRWKLKHKLMWEEANGPIPKVHCLIFLDGDKKNISLDNLQLITRAQLVRMNQNGLISDNPDVTKTGIIIADIYCKIGERKKQG